MNRRRSIIGASGGAAPDKYSWDGVLFHIQNGDYATEYSIGDLIPLDLGTEGNINMQIAAFDADDRADGNGKAHISFISKELLLTDKRMNPPQSGSWGSYEEGTGCIGGWEKSEIRSYLKTTIKPLIPQPVQSAIIEVSKTQTSFESHGYGVSQTTSDDLWLPIWGGEIADSPETTGIYKGLFPNNASRQKYTIGKTSTNRWWLRNGSTSTNFEGIMYGGTFASLGSDNYSGIVLCFCL